MKPSCQVDKKLVNQRHTQSECENYVIGNQLENNTESLRRQTSVETFTDQTQNTQLNPLQIKLLPTLKVLLNKYKIQLYNCNKNYVIFSHLKRPKLKHRK